MKRLHEALRTGKGSNYCGPVALAMLTGTDRLTATEALRKVTGRRRIVNVWVPEMRAALRRLGYSCSKIELSGQPTLAKFLRERPAEIARTPLLVMVTGHYMVIQGRKGGDSLTDGKLCWLSQLPKRRARVKGVWVVEK